MTTLANELAALRQQLTTMLPPEAIATIDRTTDELVAQKLEAGALQPGQRIVDFVLPDATGRSVASMALRAAAPLLITFYRGEWCPYCNLALNALQRDLPAFAARGVQLVAISPEKPDHALTMQQKHALAFPVLSDAGNAVAASFGLVFDLPAEVRALYRGFGIELPARNGGDRHTLPMPGTFLIGRDGTVLAGAVDSDYRRRTEPADVLGWIDRLLPGTMKAAA